MEISINGQGITISERLSQYVEKKVGRLDRYMPNLVDVRVDLSETNARNMEERTVAQITIRDSRGTILRAEERSDDIFAAIDTVVDKLYRQIRKYRGKQQRKDRNAGEKFIAGDPLPIEDAVIEEDLTQDIVRRKQFLLNPMSTEEAIDQMELLGHDFFVFFNPDEDQVNIVYKRHDSNYGLLQPELG